MRLRLLLAVILAGLGLAGCMSQNYSREYPAIVGQEFVTTRPLYLMEGARTTSVFWGTSTPTWWLVEIEEGTQYDLRPGRGLRRTEKPGDEPTRYTDLPVGTRLRVDQVLSHFETGIHVIGTLVHPDTGERVPWAFNLGLYARDDVKFPWDAAGK
ncbi:MAG TPA: hypothetical protein VEB66_11950 [Opitutaceae bacterium]|nr:hypothetical protein [Opitutaceae bacterium]